MLRLDSATRAEVPVRLDSPFKTGDVVAFKVKASRGGYLALVSPGTARQLIRDMRPLARTGAGPRSAGHSRPASTAARSRPRC